MDEIFEEIRKERERQDGKFGETFDAKNTANDWAAYINHYMPTGFHTTTPEFERKMVQIAAIAVAAIQASRRNDGPAKRHYD